MSPVFFICTRGSSILTREIVFSVGSNLPLLLGRLHVFEINVDSSDV